MIHSSLGSISPLGGVCYPFGVTGVVILHKRETRAPQPFQTPAKTPVFVPKTPVFGLL